MRIRLLLPLVAALALAVPAPAQTIDVVATTSSMGVLARVVGGPAVKVTVLAPPDRDAHYLIARPSMMLALRRADLLVAVGADLEVGWLPAALRSAGNRKVLPGQPGYFEGAAHVDLLEKGQAADRSRGDVHPAGNPHYYMDPLRLSGAARALASHLARLRPGSATAFAANADAFAKAASERVVQWKARAAGAPGVLLFHKDVNYLADLLGVPIVGYVEPVPGVPPTASHLRDLVTRLQGTRGVILHAAFQPSDGPQYLAKNLGWPVQRLQLEPPPDADLPAYLAHVERWVAAVASAK
ncbi:MAG TPA: zinc ABC transporter substrate-binding protein [Vicinamibacterales bacterium]|nr:zinc ABC transporter substrate-binding protein [Vicinamibacterales bacterium]